MTAAKDNPDGVVQKVRRQSGVIILDLAGDVDLHCATGLRSRLIEIMNEKPPLAVINLSRVDFMDSSGLATLIEALQLSRRFGGQLRLAGIRERVRSIFEIARLDTIFQIFNTEAEALA